MNRKMKKNPITVCLLLLAQVITGIHLNAAEKPNGIITLVDDMGFSDIGAYGGEITPPLSPLSGPFKGALKRPTQKAKS